jgi:hypothetical protein
VDCPGDGIALGGGGDSDDPSPGNGWLISAPLENNSTTDLAEDGDVPTGWYVEWEDIDAIGNQDNATVYAICFDPTP